MLQDDEGGTTLIRHLPLIPPFSMTLFDVISHGRLIFLIGLA